jgi:predicted permease
MGVWRRFVSLFRSGLSWFPWYRRRAREAELERELRGHLELETEEQQAIGLSPREASRAAHLALGNTMKIEEDVRAAWGFQWIETFAQDVRYAMRMLRKSPGFAVIAIITLALGIGANTAMFSVVDGVLLNPLPYPHPNQLIEVAEHDPPFNESSISYPNFLDWVRDNHTFQSLAAYRPNSFNLTGAGQPERVKATQVSASFFPLLGVKPAIGRNFTATEDKRGAAPVVMLSEGLWKTKFGSSPDILGKAITLDGAAYTIVGVVPANFYFCCESTDFIPGDVYTPIGAWANNSLYRRDNHWATYGVGRLKSGVTLAQAQADMDSVAHALAVAYPEADSRSGIFLAALKNRWVSDIKPMLFVLLAAVGFVLLIACVNVASLLLARSTARSREFAIRAALGATQRRVIRQLLTESMLLSAAGGGLGLLLAWWGTGAALSALPQALPRANDVGIDARVLLFTLTVCIVVGVLFGLAPALKTSRPDLHETLKEGGRGASGAKYRMQGIFVVAEIALAVVLLISAGLAIRSMMRLWNVNPGFNPHDALGFAVALPPAMAKETPDQFRASLTDLRQTIAAVPGVEAVTSDDGAFPFAGDDEVSFWIEGQPKPPMLSQMDSALFYVVSQDYLKAMQTPLLQGRFFTPQDSAHAPKVAVIDDSFARKYFPNKNPIGQIINLPGFGKGTLQVQIIGVVRHVMQFSLESPGPVKIAIYLPEVQLPDSDTKETLAGFLVRTQSPHYASASAIQSAIEKANSEEIPFEMESMDDAISDSLASRRFAMILLGVFAALALLLGSIGIYGVMSYVAGQRTHEIGIRIALGAQRNDVLRIALSQGARLAVIGVVIGLVAAAGVTRLMSTILFGVSASDPLTFAVVAVVLLAVALLACYIPARRAMKVDPMVALRYE